MEMKKTVVLAAFLAIFGQASSTYDAKCKAWRPDGTLVQNGFCEVSVGIAGMSETIVYQLDFQNVTVTIRVAEDRCEAQGIPCIFSTFKYRNTMRSASEDGSIFEFTAPPKNSF